MNGRFAILAGRIRQEIAALERAVERVERAVAIRQQSSTESDLLIDSAALNLHDFSSGLERIFTQIASTVDQRVPSGTNWRRELYEIRMITAGLAHHVSPLPSQRERGWG